MGLDFSRAKAIADAVLYEGYALYPYRASARKNRFRWQFGVAFPPVYAEVMGERAWLGTVCLLEGDSATDLAVQARFFHIERRRIQGTESGEPVATIPELRLEEQVYVSWDEGVERTVQWVGTIGETFGDGVRVPFSIESSTEVTALTDSAGHAVGHLVRRREGLVGTLLVRAEPVEHRLIRLEASLENLTPLTSAAAHERAEAIAFAFVSVHLLLGTTRGAFCSAMDPPRAIARHSITLSHGLFPVLVGEPGERQLMLAAPIILYDYPQVAPESPRLLYDATEIDELLILRTLLLTEEEKREARATDPRIAELLDQLERLSPDTLTRLHGAIRSRRVWGANPDTAVLVGRRVRLYPQLGRTDAQDWFLVGKIAIVAEVRTDIDGTTFLGVTLADDPDADLLRDWGRFRYFRLDEVELLPEGASGCASS
ncbi:MAG: hypothetical protein RMH81_09090 [Thermomicrobium sp.]|nr:hypothetical protein [Thermomicrobium sp.]